MKPTLEEYNKAKSSITFATSALQQCRARRDELIDALADERQDEKHYLQLIERYKETVMLYEIYEKNEKRQEEIK
jgi:hypothetical protein